MGRLMLVWLAEQSAKCKRIVEVGCYRGRSTRAMIDNSRAHIWCLDSWSGTHTTADDHVRFLTNVQDSLDRLTILKMDSVKGTKKLLKRFGPGHFDLMFIDACHDYKCVRADIIACRPLVRRGGILAGHDYANGWPGVRRAVNELVPDKQIVPKGAIWWTKLS